jgi:hypothetical protein
MNVRSSPEVRGKLQRAYGRCYDCYGKGQRKNIVGHVAKCPTCDGSGKITAYTACQLAMASELSIARTYDALLDLEELGLASRRADGDSELWRLGRIKSSVQGEGSSQ